MIKTFKQFDKDFREQYSIKDDYIIKTDSDMEDVLYEIYGAERYEIDYENKIIDLF